MTTWEYVALEPTGRKRTGYIDAVDREAAIATVGHAGNFVIEIKETKKASQTSIGAVARSGKVSRADIAMFSRRMADLAIAGLPLDRVLQVVAEQSESRLLAEIAEEALVDVRSGLPVSQALAKHPKYFPEVYTQTLKAGEASGQFGEVTARLAEFQEMEVTRRSQIVSALIYPAVLTFTAIGVVIFLITFVVPKLSGVFNALGNDLPVTTRLLLDTADFLTSKGLYILGGLVGLYILYRGWVATDSGSYTRDRLLLHVPVAGKIISKAVISRFARVLGTQVYGGVPILNALELAGMASGNRVFREKSQTVEREVREGRPIADAMRDAGDFPPVLTHMVAIGEETGDLAKMLGRVSDSLDFEVDNGMRRLIALAEPIIVLAMGGIVGFIVLSVLLPIYQAQNLVK